jgi:WD repeat-containing protein 48
VICAWDLNLDLTPFSDRSFNSSPNSSGAAVNKNAQPAAHRQQVQAHTHWINDIVLAQNNEALVSASSDITVKLWRPDAHDPHPPQTIGLHSDYVKTLASPGSHSNWVASGGLDRKIYLWDLNGGGQQLEINVGEDEDTAKGSVYALAVTSTLLAGGGPESIVRVWDPRSGKRITKFVGHTDNIRDILISQDGDTVMTASSDQTVKVWSMTAGRCMYTLTMHNDSVWSLYSDHPRLSVFYSSDRSGLVAKTDTRGCPEMDEGIAVAVCQEHGGVNKVVNAGDYVWTGTASSSINRWLDVDTEADVQIPETYSFHRVSVATTTRSRMPSVSQVPPPAATNSQSNQSSKQIPYKSVLRLSNAAPFYIRNREDTSTMYSAASVRKATEPIVDSDPGAVIPYRSLPDHTIEGQHGLIKHVTLSDKRRVLTLDTASEVLMWDLIQCMPIQAFGKRHLEEVVREVNTTETVASWCAVDTRTGCLTCVLEENTCFDAEMYADEVDIEEQIDFREDQRINLGKWILRYLFCNLIDEEIRRDEVYRHMLLDSKTQVIDRAGAPSNIQMPTAALSSWLDTSSTPTSASTLKATNGFQFPVHTPGLNIGLATPAPLPMMPPTTTMQSGALSPTKEEGGGSQRGHARTPSDSKHGNDYFSSQPNMGIGTPTTPGGTANGQLTAPADASSDQIPTTPDATVPDTPSTEKTGMFGKKMWKNFGMKSLKKTQTKDANPAPVEERSEDSDSRSSKTEDRIIEDNFLGAIQKIRLEYDSELQVLEKNEKKGETSEGTMKLESKIQPSLPNDTPVLKPPANTTILIQEDRINSGGVADLFEGTVGSLGSQADLIEKLAPVWLADVLLKVRLFFQI